MANGILRSEGVGSFGGQEVKTKGEGEQWYVWEVGRGNWEVLPKWQWKV